jgi:hypothetical protein
MINPSAAKNIIRESVGGTATVVSRADFVGSTPVRLRNRLLLIGTVALLISLGIIVWREGALDSLIGHFMIPQGAPPTFPANFSEVTIPFELVNEHIVLRAQIDGSRPLSFLLDTGDRYSIVDLEVANRLGVTLGGEISVHGAGSEVKPGAFVKDTSFTLVGFPGFSQRVSLAVPLTSLAPRLGHDLDGIIGSEFIKNFVVELDYQKRTITLHNRDTFSYSGPGETVPIHLTSSGHPVLEAVVTPTDGSSITADVELDVGASGALELHSKFVNDHHLPGSNVPTIRDIGTAGTGGATQGRIGRVGSFRIGTYELQKPLTVFSTDTEGSAASSDTAGNVGEELLERFKLFFDYEHNRIIFEPNATFGNAFDRAFSGLHMEAEGKDYRTFRIVEVLEKSRAVEAGLQRGDVITSVDGKPTAELVYSDVLDMFKRATTFRLTVERDGKTLNVNLTPQKLI